MTWVMAHRELNTAAVGLMTTCRCTNRSKKPRTRDSRRQVRRLAQERPRDARIPLGTYRGLRFGLVLHPQFPPDLYFEGSTTGQTALSREHHGTRAVLNDLERLATAYGSECVRVRQDLAIAKSQRRDFQAQGYWCQFLFGEKKPDTNNPALLPGLTHRTQPGAGAQETANSRPMDLGDALQDDRS